MQKVIFVLVYTQTPAHPMGAAKLNQPGRHGNSKAGRLVGYLLNKSVGFFRVCPSLGAGWVRRISVLLGIDPGSLYAYLRLKYVSRFIIDSLFIIFLSYRAVKWPVNQVPGKIPTSWRLPAKRRAAITKVFVYLLPNNSL